MNVNYDKVADAIYFSIRKGDVSKTIKINETMLADVDENGGVLGIEILDVSNQFHTDDVSEIEKKALEGIPLTVTSSTPEQL